MSPDARLSRRIGLTALYVSQLHRLLAPLTSGRGAILAFNRVRPRPETSFQPNAALDVTPTFLARLVERLRRQQVDIVDLDEAVRRIGGSGSKRRFVVITFDDGYADNLEHAYPLLKEQNCPFALFIATGLLDRQIAPWWRVLEEVIGRQETVAVSRDGPVSYYDCRGRAGKYAAFAELRSWLQELGPERRRQAIDELAWRYGIDPGGVVDSETMDWARLRKLAADPLVTIGAHSIRHDSLAELPEAQVRMEARDSARVLEAATGVAPRHFAYPHGGRNAAGAREYGIIRDLGFATGLTTIPGVVRAGDAANLTALPRLSIGGNLQAWRYLEVLLSGVPLLLARRPAKAGPGAAGARLKAAASS